MTKEKALIPEGFEIYPEQKRLVLLDVDLIVHDAFAFSDGLTCFTVNCGENGWWVDLFLHVESLEKRDLWAIPADWVFSGMPEAGTAVEIADLIAEVSCRTRPVPKKFLDIGPVPELAGNWSGFDDWEWS